MPSVSSVTSSTQIGSIVGGEQAPYVFSPHVGDTLSYASSTAPSVVGQAWDSSGMRMPTNGEYLPTGESGYPEQMPIHSGPPAYIDDDKSRPVDIRKS